MTHDEYSENVDQLFINYFYFGRDIGVNSVLCEIAVEVGLDLKTVEAYLDTSEDKEHVYNENARAHSSPLLLASSYKQAGLYASFCVGILF